MAKFYSNSIERFENDLRKKLLKIDYKSKEIIINSIITYLETGHMRRRDDILGEIMMQFKQVEDHLDKYDDVLNKRIEKNFMYDGFEIQTNKTVEGERRVRNETNQKRYEYSLQYTNIYTSAIQNVNESNFDETIDYVLDSEPKFEKDGRFFSLVNIISFSVVVAFLQDLSYNFFENAIENKQNLVYTNYFDDCSPLCIDYQNDVFYTIRPESGYRYFREALWENGGGIGHPNCRHIFSPFTGNELNKNPLSKEEISENYKVDQSEKQKLRYYEKKAQKTEEKVKYTKRKNKKIKPKTKNKDFVQIERYQSRLQKEIATQKKYLNKTESISEKASINKRISILEKKNADLEIKKYTNEKVSKYF